MVHFLSKLVQMKDFTNCRNWDSNPDWMYKGGEIKFRKCFMKLSGKS